MQIVACPKIAFDISLPHVFAPHFVYQDCAYNIVACLVTNQTIFIVDIQYVV